MKIGVSACLVGNMCRYDGFHAKDDFVIDVIQQFFELVTFCPEDVAFGTPRPTIRLVEQNSEIKVVVTSTQEDVTQKLDEVCNTMANNLQDEPLCGFILKSKSPTCGLERVKVYEKKDAPCEKKGIGRFAAQILKRYPYLPIEEEGRLNDAWLKENFLMQVFAYKHIHEFLEKSPTANDLVQFHTAYKYLIYAKSQTSYKQLGNIVANHEKKPIEEVLKIYQEAFLQAIAQKGSIAKTYNVLLHIYGYFKNHLNKEQKQYVLDSLEEFKNKIIPLIAIIKMFNIYIDLYDIAYLKQQKFLDPYPKNLALRSTVQAYK
jgi:uncharacterized protein YbgA (DUF1722 family)/uncharacterized protein YbbK (DUF523 family)